MAMTWVQKGGARKAGAEMLVDVGNGPELRTTIGYCGTSVVYVNGGGDVLDRAYALDRLRRGESVWYQRWERMDEEQERNTRAQRAVWDAMYDASWEHTCAMEHVREGKRNGCGLDEMRILDKAEKEARARYRAAEARYITYVNEKNKQVIAA